jgi:alpha-L-fucosidase
MKKHLKIILIVCFPLIVLCQDKKQPLPTKAQLEWHEQEFYLFIHFGPNTFTDKEWGHGDEPAAVFNPAQLDCRQWARIAKESGAKGIIITAKHHDGFCLWPSKYSKHTVRESKWKNGKGDVLKELSDACREYGLKFGVYISPWDRNHPDYGTEKYNDVFVGMMKELFTNYGPIWELWWDGANGEGPNGKRQVYDWHRFKETVKQLSPNTVVFSDVGPHIRWVGNEKGIAGETNWNTLDTTGYTPGLGAPHVDTLNTGNINGEAWIPAECDVSIRPGWFYHEKEDDKVKSATELFDLYLKSVGRGANFLLNVPPAKNGLIHPTDSISLVGFAAKMQQLKESFPMYDGSSLRSLTDGNPGTQLKIDSSHMIFLWRPQDVNCVRVREAIQYGQSVIRFKLVLYDSAKMLFEKEYTTIGRNRLLTFPLQKKVTAVELVFLEAKADVLISEVAAYKLEE